MTAAPTLRSSTCSAAGLPEDEDEEDQEALAVLHSRSRGEDEDQENTGDAERSDAGGDSHSNITKSNTNDDEADSAAPVPSTPGKDMFHFPTRKRKAFDSYVDAGRQHLDDTEIDADTPTRTGKKKVRMLAPGEDVATPTRGGTGGVEVLGRPPRFDIGVGADGGTPARRRQRKATKRILSVLATGSEDEDEEDEEEEEEEEEEDEEDGGDGDGDKDEGGVDGDDISDDVAEPGHQSYFTSARPATTQRNKKGGRLATTTSKTSNNTLSRLPSLSQLSTTTTTSFRPQKHAAETALLTSLYRDQFPEWFFELRQGFNLVFYGYGSKRALLNEFALEVLSADAAVVVVNGFFPAISLKSILNSIADKLIPSYTTAKNSTTNRTMSAPTDQLTHLLTRITRRTYLLIHNIDAPPLRARATQAAFARLAAHPHIHLLATIDHINAPLLWDNVAAHNFNWLWRDLTTFADYEVETLRAGNTTLGARCARAGLGEVGGVAGATDGARTLSAVLHVLRSLNSNARGIFRLLCEHQLAAGDETDPASPSQQQKGNSSNNITQPGLSHELWYAKAREKFLVGNDITFRTQLGEFRDHAIVVARKSPGDGREVLAVPLDRETLEAVLEGMAEEG